MIARSSNPAIKVEMIAVCDLWKVNREKAVTTNSGYYGRRPGACNIRRNCWR